MGTRLEQIQAAAKAKQAAGQPIAAKPIATPQTPAPAVGVSAAPAVSAPVQNTASSIKSTNALSPQIAAEVQRKANAGIALTNPTAATQSAYNAAVKPAVAAPKPTAPAAAPAPTSAAVAPNTNYVQQGGKALNDLLYLKKSYESGKTGAAAYAGQYYNQLDPNTAAAVKNMNAAQLEQYISGLGQQSQQQGTPVAVTTSANPQPYMQLGPDQIAQQADFQIATERANRQRVLDSTTAALKNNYDYSNQIEQDNRQLQDASFYRNNAPASQDGSTGYRGAMLDRNRSIQDTATQRDFNSQLATAQQAFADWDNLSTQQRQALVNDMTRLERDYGLQVGQLTGSFNGQRTLAGQAQDWGQTVDRANLTGTFDGQKTAAQANADRDYNLRADDQSFGQGVTMAQLTGYLPNGQQTTAEQQRQLQNLWTAAEQTGVIPDQLATLYGLPKGTPTQSAYQFAQNFAMDQAQFSLSQQNAQNSMENSGFGRLMDVWKATGAAPSGLEAYGIAPGEQWYQEAAQIKENSMTPQQVLTNIRDLYQEPVYTKDALGNMVANGTKLTTDPAKRKQMFNNVVDSGLSNKETMQVLASLQYSKEEITKLYNEGLSSGGQ
jgi:regulator of replication initiation timing